MEAITVQRRQQENQFLVVAVILDLVSHPPVARNDVVREDLGPAEWTRGAVELEPRVQAVLVEDVAALQRPDLVAALELRQADPALRRRRALSVVGELARRAGPLDELEGLHGGDHARVGPRLRAGDRPDKREELEQEEGEEDEGHGVDVGEEF